MAPSPVSPGNHRGYLMPIGGAEEKGNNPRILSRFLEICGGEKARIMIIPTASRLPETGPMYADLFMDLGAERALYTEINERSDCEDDLLLEEMDNATGIFVTGGNQARCRNRSCLRREEVSELAIAVLQELDDDALTTRQAVRMIMRMNNK